MTDREVMQMALDVLKTFKCPQNPDVPQTIVMLERMLAQPEQPEALLTFSEVQATITMSRSFVYKEIAEGRINPIKIGKSIRFAKSEIDKWVLSQMAAR